MRHISQLSDSEHSMYENLLIIWFFLLAVSWTLHVLKVIYYELQSWPINIYINYIHIHYLYIIYISLKILHIDLEYNNWQYSRITPGFMLRITLVSKLGEPHAEQVLNQLYYLSFPNLVTLLLILMPYLYSLDNFVFVVHVWEDYLVTDIKHKLYMYI